MKGKKLYVGNLNYDCTSEQLQELFSTYGTVESAKVIERKGFGFIEMSTEAEAEEAQNALNGQDFQGRPLKIDEARPQTNFKSRPQRY
ncbi:MAG: RNA-binding protein [Spirochaetales bacterium]|nr:RNA-binding protein [Spirochaetales bacterium]